MRLLSCVLILHVCPNAQNICHMRPRPLCALAYLQQVETKYPSLPLTYIGNRMDYNHNQDNNKD